ncbi:hypothetical protein [Litorivita sp. NS0012-18]
MKHKQQPHVMNHSAPSPRLTPWAALLVACALSVPFACAAIISLLF